MSAKHRARCKAGKRIIHVFTIPSFGSRERSGLQVNISSLDLGPARCRADGNGAVDDEFAALKNRDGYSHVFEVK